jgi:hypothetical protein
MTYSKLRCIISNVRGIDSRIVVALNRGLISRLAQQELEAVVVRGEKLLVLNRRSKIKPSQKNKKIKRGAEREKQLMVSANDFKKIVKRKDKEQDRKRKTCKTKISRN